MNSKRFFFIMLAVLLILGAGIIGTVYFGNSLLEKQSNKLLKLKLDSEVADKQQSSLSLAKKDIKDFSDLKASADAIVPQDKDQAEAVREIVKIADNNKIVLGSITFPASNLGQIKAPTTTTGGANSATKAPSVTQVQPVTGIVGVYVMPITVQSDSNKKIPYTSFINFLHDLEQNRRTAQVSSVTITPDKQNNNNLTFLLVLNVYLKP